MDIPCDPSPSSLLTEFCVYHIYICNKVGDVLMKRNSRRVRVTTVAMEKK